MKTYKIFCRFSIKIDYSDLTEWFKYRTEVLNFIKLNIDKNVFGQVTVLTESFPVFVCCDPEDMLLLKLKYSELFIEES